MIVLLLVFLIADISGIHIYHSLNTSESLDVVLRSAEKSGLEYNSDTLQDGDIIIYLNKPHILFLCGADDINEQLSGHGEAVVVDDLENKAVLIGKKSNIDNVLANDTDGNIKLIVLEDLIHLLEENVGIGMLEENRVYDYQHDSKPCIVTARPTQLNLFYRFANYIPRVNSLVTWSDSVKWHGNCHVCKDLEKSTQLGSEDKVVVAGFILQWTPLLRNWLYNLLSQDLPKATSRFYLIYCNVTEHEQTIRDFTGGMSELDVLVLDTSFFKDKNLSDVMTHSTTMCTAVNCTYMFSVNSVVSLLRTNAITHLVQYNRSVIAPFVQSKPGNVPNFWGDISADGWYIRSPDYFDILDGAKGLFVVPFIKSVYLTKASALPDYYNDVYLDSDTDMAMAANYRNKSTLMWLDSTLVCGLYTNMTRTDYPLSDPDLYALSANYHGFVDYALNKNVAFTLDDVNELQGPCVESLVLPLFKDEYCASFVRALDKYNWAVADKVQVIKMSEFEYHDIIESLVMKSVVPYFKQKFNLDYELIDITMGESVLFIQDKGTNELVPDTIVTYKTSYHVIFFLTDNQSQGLQFPEESCKSHLPRGSVLVSRKVKDRSVTLIDTDVRNIGIYTILYI